jgi:hypothetical protein
MNKTQKFQVSGVVANEQNRTKTPASSATTTDNMKVPGRGDKALNCKVSFQIVNIVNSEENRCKLLLQPIVTQVGGDRSRRESVLTQDLVNEKTKDKFVENKISNECATDFRFCGADYQSMWIITHGMSADSSVRADNHLQTGKAISSSFAEAKPLVLFYDWGDMSQDAGGVNPHNVDQYLSRNTSWLLAERLKSWGMKDKSNLNLVGHSMGTIMINQFAYALQNREGVTGEIKRMFYLDPPNWPLQQFVTDESSVLSKWSNQTNYNRIDGYVTDARKIDVKVVRAFEGLNPVIATNGCGNHDFAKTSGSVIGIWNKNDNNPLDLINACKIHGGVPYVFADLIRDYKNGIKVSRYEKFILPVPIKIGSQNYDLINLKYLPYAGTTEDGYDAIIRNEGLEGKNEIQSSLSNDNFNYSGKIFKY